ncbi:MAG: HAMP domain-containing sensor histidine kinase, partial [Bacteroidota bacterium]
TNEREQFKFLVSATQIVLNKESILLVVIQNIKQELDQKETESWSKLIRVMTHEIMNTVAPITSVSASLLNHYFSEKGELLHPDLKVEHSHKIFEGLEIIKEQSQGLTSFVQSYRSLLNIPKPQKVIINVPELLAKVRLMMEKDLQSQQIELLIMNTHPDFEVFADEQQLTQVLVNLIKNAIQAQKGSKNGWIKMDCGKHSEGQKFIKISDNGPGIPTENIEQIFIPFFTTKVNGTGTGLSLVKQIMSLHGGRVEVSSFNNTGVEFVLFF